MFVESCFRNRLPAASILTSSPASTVKSSPGVSVIDPVPPAVTLTSWLLAALTVTAPALLTTSRSPLELPWRTVIAPAVPAPVFASTTMPPFVVAPAPLDIVTAPLVCAAPLDTVTAPPAPPDAEPPAPPDNVNAPPTPVVDVVDAPPEMLTAPPVPLDAALLNTLTSWLLTALTVTAPAASQLRMFVESCFSASVDDASDFSTTSSPLIVRS